MVRPPHDHRKHLIGYSTTANHRQSTTSYLSINHRYVCSGVLGVRFSCCSGLSNTARSSRSLSVSRVSVYAPQVVCRLSSRSGVQGRVKVPSSLDALFFQPFIPYDAAVTVVVRTPHDARTRLLNPCRGSLTRRHYALRQLWLCLFPFALLIGCSLMTFIPLQRRS